MAEIEVVDDVTVAAPLAHGFGRKMVFETDVVRVGQTRVAAGAVSSWHHHGKRTLFGYVLQGELTLEHGPSGAREVCVRPGSFVRVAPGVVHRDVNRGQEETLIVSILVGEGPPTIDVVGPDA